MVTTEPLRGRLAWRVVRVETVQGGAESPLVVGAILPATPSPNGSSVLGRALTADVRLDHASVSRAHAVLRHEDGPHALVLTAQSTASATFVGGVRIAAGTSTPLPLGAHVQLGAVVLQLIEQTDTVPFETPLAVGGTEGPPPTRPRPALSLEVIIDGPAISARVNGALLHLTPRAAQLLALLAERAGLTVAHWDLVDALGGRGIPQLATELRQGFKRLLAAGILDGEALCRALAEANAGAPARGLGEETPERLAARVVLARRTHGYVLCLPASCCSVRRHS